MQDVAESLHQDTFAGGASDRDEREIAPVRGDSSMLPARYIR